MRSPLSIGLRAAAALAVLAAMTGCGQGYPQSPDAARSALVGTTIPDIAFGKSAHSAPGEATAEGVAWTIVRGPDEYGGSPGDSDGGEVMKLAARLTPTSGGVEVSVDVEPPTGGDPKRLAEAKSQRPAVFNYFRTVAREQVDAVLTHRDFSFGAVSGDMAVATVSMLPEIRKQLDDAAAAYDRHDQEMMHRAYELAGRGSE